MISKIDCLGIVRQHLLTLRNDGKGKASLADILLFYFFPVLVAGAIVFGLDRSLTAGAANALATVFSIFIGLLLNLLVLIFDLVRSDEKVEATPRTEIRKKVLQETFSNISYAILISVLLVVILFGSRLAPAGAFTDSFSVLAFAMVGNFLLTLLMVLKRVHALLSGEAKS